MSIFRLFHLFQWEIFCRSRSMFDFNSLLKFIYKVAKLSGFVFISIDFKSKQKLKTKKDFRNIIIFVISFCLSLFSITYDAKFTVMNVTHSKLMEIIINLMVDLLVFSPCLIKIVNVFQRLQFFSIISGLHWTEQKVG